MLLLPLLAAAQLVHAQCFSLAATTACPEYKDFSVAVSPTHYQNVAAFDAFITERNKLFRSDCGKLSTVSEATYSKSMACSFAVNSALSLRCNTAGKKPKQLCGSTAKLAMASVKAVAKSVCPTATFSSYDSYAAALTDKDCFVAIGDDTKLKCGLANAAAFCAANADALCCKATSNLVGPEGLGAAVAVTTREAALAAPTTKVEELAPVTSDAPAPAPTATTAAKEEKEDSEGVSPLLILGIGAGILLAAAIAFGIYYMLGKKKSSDPKDSQSRSAPAIGSVPGGIGADQDEEVMEVIFEYEANLFDELTLETGDLVIVKNAFDDGWAIGYNQTSGKEGTFPLACIAPVGSGNEYRESTYSKRTSSFYASSYAPPEEQPYGDFDGGRNYGEQDFNDGRNYGQKQNYRN